MMMAINYINMLFHSKASGCLYFIAHFIKKLKSSEGPEASFLIQNIPFSAKLVTATPLGSPIQLTLKWPPPSLSLDTLIGSQLFIIGV